MKISASSLLVILLIFGATYLSIQSMENENNPPSLHWYIKNLPNKITFTQEEKEILQKAYVSIDEKILDCKSEQEVCNLILKNLDKRYQDVVDHLKINHSVIPLSKNGAYMFTAERLTQITDFYNKKGYNLFEESPAIQTDHNTVLWKNKIWKNAVLVPKEKLDLLYAATTHLNITNNFFITVLSKSDNLGSLTLNDPTAYILPEDYAFILHISPDTAKNLTLNPLLCLPIFLHQLTKLINGTGVKKTALDNGFQYYVLGSGNLMSKTCDNTLERKKIDWQKAATLYADIAAIICPPNNKQFDQNERQILYKLSLKILCEKVASRIENDPFSIARIGLLFYLYKLTMN